MKKLCLFALAVVSLSSCKKDAENTPSRTELLTANRWQVTAYTSTLTLSATTGTTASPASVTTTDKYASLPPCEKDNFTKYNTDKTMVQDEGPTKCYSSAAQKEDYSWDFADNQTKLLLKTPGSSRAHASTILELSATTLRIREAYSYNTGYVTSTTVDEITYTAF